MKKKTLLKITTFSFATCLAAGIFVCSNPAQASAEDKTPSCEIFAQTLSLQDNIYIRYAVDFQELADGDKTGVIVWNAPQESYDSENFNNENAKAAVKSTVECSYNGNTYPTFAYTELAAKNMTDVVYARAYVERDGTYYYSNVKKYSILEYAYNKLGMTEAKETEDEDLKNLLNAMLAYGGAAQKAFNHKADAPASVDGFTYVRVANATFEDGFSYGLFQKGSTVKVIPDEGYYFSSTEDSTFTKNDDGTYSFIVPETKTIDLTSLEKYSVGLRYNQNKDGTYEVSGVGDCTDTEIVIPSVYNGNAVTGIRERAFIQCSNLTSVIIPDSVTSIGLAAFYNCSGLTSVTIPSSVTSIGDSAFQECSGLTSVTIPSSVTSIGNRVFAYCGLTSVTIPSSVTSIGNGVFQSCSGLTSVTIPSSVTSIGDDAFAYCGLTSVTIPSSVTSISSSAFSVCRRLVSIEVSADNATYQSIDGNVYGKDGKTFIMVAPAKQNVTVADGVTDIGAQAFESDTALESVTLPESVSVIGEKAFYGCTLLINLTFKGTKAQWEEVDKKSDWNTNCHPTRFAVYCTGIAEDVTPSEGLTYTLSGDEQSYIVSGIGTCTDVHIVIPNTYNDLPVTSIADRAFKGNGQLKTVRLGSNVTSIGEWAFYGCSNLTSVTFPDSLTTIGTRAFQVCSGLTSVTIPAGVQTIGEYAFGACTSLTSAVIRNGVKSIGNYAFAKCSGLTSVEIPESVTSIGNNAFAECSGLTNVDISNGVTSIGDKAFDGCSGLTRIEIPESVTSIGDSVFNGCINVTSIDVSENNGAFRSLDGNLYSKDGTILVQYAVAKTETTFEIPDGVVTIGSGAFQGGRALVSVTIPDSVERINERAFQDCSELTSITIPVKVQYFFSKAFSGCSKLKSIYLPSKFYSFNGNDVFSGCDSLTEVYYANTIKEWNWAVKTTENKLPSGCIVICTDGELTIE